MSQTKVSVWLFIVQKTTVHQINSFPVEMGPDMVESFNGEELLSSEPFVCIISEDQRFDNFLRTVLIWMWNNYLGSKDAQYV